MAAKLLKSPLTDERMKWSKQALADLKKEIVQLASRNKQRQAAPPRILFMGETGSGKSSLISSIVSALYGHIVYTSTVGEKAGHEVNTSKRFLEHRVFLEKAGGEEALHFILCDSRGIAKKQQLGAAQQEISTLIDGKIRHGDLIEDESGYSAVGREVEERPPNPPSCVVFVQKASRLGEQDPEVRHKMDLACHLVRERGITSCVVLTHIDEVKVSLKNKLHLALCSSKIEERVQSACQELGVNKNRVFVVKNYVDESRTHTRHDLLILRALRGILLDVNQTSLDSFGRRITAGRFWSDDLPIDRSLPPALLQSESSGYKSTPTDEDNLTSISQRPSFRSSTVPKGRQSLRRSQVNKVTSPDPVTDFDIERNTPPRVSNRSSETQRSGQHDYRITSETNSPNIDSGQSSSSDEKDYTFIDDDVDEGFETFSCHATATGLLHDLLAALPIAVYPEQYGEPMKTRGARPLRQPVVLQRTHTSLTSLDEGPGLQQQLQKEFFREDYHRRLSADLHAWFPDVSGAVWTSDTLHNDLALPYPHYLPDSLDVQMLVLAPGHPACLLTLYDEERILSNRDVHDQQESQRLKSRETKDVEVACSQMCKLLTTAILTFSSCDFILLPVCLDLKNLSVSSVKQGIDQQVHRSRKYYGGPSKLSLSAYGQLRSAVTAVVAVSRVPRLLHDLASPREEKETMVLLDKDWRGVVSLLIEKLTRVDNVNQSAFVYYPTDGQLKMCVAVLETARRLSFGEEVVIITDIESLRRAVVPLKQKVKDSTGLDLNLSVVTPYTGFQKDVETSSASYVMILDNPHIELKLDTVTLHLLAK